MSMVTYPLNGIEYTAEDAELFHVTRTSGVYAKNSFDYSVTGADNTIVIGTGIGWIKNSEFSGKVIAQKEPISIDLGLPDSVYPRIDSVIIKFDANSNGTNIFVKNGVPSSNPVAPPVVRTESVYELHLYHILRNAGALAISSSNITDLRLNPNYCGLMAESITNIGADSEDKKVEIHQLWENANYTSSFPAQEISLDLSQYDAAEIELYSPAAGTTHPTPYIRFFKVLKNGTCCMQLTRVGGDGGGSIPVFSFRYVSLFDDRISFSGHDYMDGATQQQIKADNAALVPVRIYGIKGVQK